MIFKTKYLANLLWIVWYDYMKICELLLEVEYDVYHSVVIELCGEVDMVGEYIYVDWLWYFWWIHICWLIVILLVNTYMLIDCDIVGEYIYVNWLWYCWWMHMQSPTKSPSLITITKIMVIWWWCGELFVWTYALLWVICSCIYDW